LSNAAQQSFWQIRHCKNLPSASWPGSGRTCGRSGRANLRRNRANLLRLSGRRPADAVSVADSSNEDGRATVTKKSAKAPRKLPVGDRRQFLTTMSADVIRAVKLAALEDGMNAWEIMEEAAKDWLARRKAEKRTKKAKTE
jgi:hypothetical protein